MSDVVAFKPPNRSDDFLPLVLFLLDPNLLESHLAKENEDSAIQLIIRFLTKAPQQPKEIKENGRENSIPDVDIISDGRLPGENIKYQALQLLSFKTAAFLKWNLDVLNKGLPFPMLYCLLSSFLDLTFKDSTVFPEQKPHEMNFAELPHQTLFALQLYHRWCLHAVINESFPKRPPLSIAVSLPGQTDPSIVHPAVIESILKNVKEMISESIECLEKFLNQSLSLKMPTMDCISCFKLYVDHEWDNGLPIPVEELICQISYDLGCYYFFQENYSKSLERWSEVCTLLPKITNPVFLVIEKDRLQGYLKALSSVQEVYKQELSITEKVEISRKNNFENIVPLLIEDTIKDELSWSYSNYTEQEIASGKYGTDSVLQFQVCTCNFVKSLFKGKVASPFYMELLKQQSKANVDFFIKTLSDALPHSTSLQKKNVKLFLRYLCTTYLSQDMVCHIVNSPLSQVIDLSDIRIIQDSNDRVYQPIADAVGYTDNISLRIGDLERKLCLSYDPQEIKSLIVQLSAFAPKKQLWTINFKWEIARELHQQVINLPYELHDLVPILLAKAKECMNLKSFSIAKDLLFAAEAECKESFRLVKLVKWELLFCDLLELQSCKEQRSDALPNSDCTRKVKTCLTALTLDSDVAPRAEIVEQCAAFLLNVQDWDYLITSDHKNNGHLIFSGYLASVCRMVQANKANRSTAEEFWEAVLHIFYLNTQQKRTSSGLINSVYRENSFACMSRANFNLFIFKIKEESPLGILLSCLSKIYNILRDDLSNDVYLEYSNLWPTVLRDSGAYNLPGLYDSLKDLLKHILTVNPVHPGWLRSQGDFFFGQNQYAPALKHYLQAGVVGSDFFSVQVPKTIFDDQVHHRMIKCCSQLQCFTQVAVLCQFLEEVDYATAFKALQEKGSTDGMDTYYNCIWDIAILEFLIYIHTKRGEWGKKQLALKAIGQLELNASNHEDILNQAMQVRKNRFLRAMAKQYL